MLTGIVFACLTSYSFLSLRFPCFAPSTGLQLWRSTRYLPLKETLSSDVQTPAFILMLQRCRNWTKAGYFTGMMSTLISKKGCWGLQGSSLRKQTKQTAACFMRHKLQPCVHPAYAFMLPYEDCKHITQPAFSHLVMTGLWECALMFFSMIKKFSFHRGCNV